MNTQLIQSMVSEIKAANDKAIADGVMTINYSGLSKIGEFLRQKSTGGYVKIIQKNRRQKIAVVIPATVEETAKLNAIN